MRNAVKHEAAPSAGAPSMPPPTVPASVYDTDYYRHWCAGFDEWTSSEGAEPAALYEWSLRRARLRPGEVVVDLGTGRGELLAVAVEMGAAHAVGVEYSLEALSLAQRTLAAHSMSGRAAAVAADTRRLPLPDAMADLVVMLDIVEHLNPEELHLTSLRGAADPAPGRAALRPHPADPDRLRRHLPVPAPRRPGTAPALARPTRGSSSSA